MADYNSLNAHPRDKYIKFTLSTHSYEVCMPDTEPVCCDSVTQVVEQCFKQFDADYWAQRKATPTCTAQMLKDMWAAKGEEARRLGTELHDRIERHYLGEEPTPEALADRGFRHFLDFDSRYRLKPFRSEWRIFSEKYRIAGTLDFLAFDGEKFVIYDWKRSLKVVDKNGKPITANPYGSRAFAPVEHLDDTTFNHYALQVSLYRYILKEEYNIDVHNCYLGVFHPELDNYALVALPYLEEEVKAILRRR